MNRQESLNRSIAEIAPQTNESTPQSSTQAPNPIGPTVPPVIQGSGRPPKSRKKLMIALLLILIVLSVGTFVYSQT